MLRRHSAPATLVLSLAAVLTAAPAARADVVDDWNGELLETLRVAPGGPGALARGSAMTHVALFDAINSINRTHEPIVAMLDCAQPCSQVAAASQAAHDVLVSLYPDRKATYDALLRKTLKRADGPAEKNGRDLGRRIADAVIAHCQDDGSANLPAYTFSDKPGQFVLPDPDLIPNAVGNGWGKVRPWVIESGRQFRPNGIQGFKRMNVLLASDEYAAQVNEVKAFGERDSAVRTAEQTEIAWFWANDRPGTYRPPGHLIEITQTIAKQQHLSAADKARLFALVSIGMADTAIAVWDCKFDTNLDLWRPVTAIREADRDNNPDTVADPDWLPLLDFTPPFPAFPSGHASFGAVHAEILRDFFGTDDMTFTVGTDEPIVKDVTRTFHSFSEAARENGISRIYLGVHYRWDADASYWMGTTIGRYIADRVALPLCPADFNSSGGVDSADMTSFTDAFFRDDSRADFNHDGRVNLYDLSNFTQAYLAGCREL